MSRLIAPEEALTRIPGWGGRYACREIGGGLTNRSYLVSATTGEFVLRLDAEHTKTFGLNRRAELKILREASKADIAPEVVFADPDAGILLYEYLPGPVWERSSLDDPQNLRSLAGLLRAVHALPASGETLDAAAAASRYASTAAKHPSLGPFVARCLSIVADIPAPTQRCCCHNDAVASNIIGTSQLKLLDWEYACDNEPLFDLASLIGYHDLDGKQSNRLLHAYTGGPDPATRERLEEQLRLYDAVQWLWLAARQVIAPSRRQCKRLHELQRRVVE